MAKKRRLLVLGLVLAVGGLTACSSDKDGDLAAACKDNIAVTDGFTKMFTNLQGPGNAPPSAEQMQQIKDTYNNLLAKPLADAVAHAPKAIRPDIKSAGEKLKVLGQTGDTSAIFDDAELDAQGHKIDLYFYDNCSGPKHAVGASDYAFGGLPNKLSSGDVQFKLTNSGTEEHELLVVKRKPGVTETFDQILALPQEEGQAKTDFVAQTMASPGKPDATTAHLAAGQYLVICTISQGTVGDKQGDGPPHFTLGMRQEFTVT